MRKLIFIVLLGFLGTAVAETPSINAVSTENVLFDQGKDPKSDLRIYPNPTYDFFSLKHDENISRFVIYNIVAKEVKRFSHIPGSKYDVGFLQRGIYIIRFYDDKERIVKVLRLNKK